MKMKYSAGMMSVPYLFSETRKTAELYINNCDSAKLKAYVLENNLYQMTSMYRAERYFNVVLRRIKSLPPALVNLIAYGSNTEAKLMVLISIMRTDLLFFEFMYEVFRDEIMVGSSVFEDKVINGFFRDKSAQSELIAKWKDTTVAHLKQYYIRVLFESGLLSDVRRPKNIMVPWISDAIRTELAKADMSIYLYAITGEQ